MKKLFLIAVLLGGTACSGAGVADLVLLNGRVYTLDEETPWAEAVAIQGEEILAVGSNGAIRGLAGSNTRTIDLDGAFALPGFNGLAEVELPLCVGGDSTDDSVGILQDLGPPLRWTIIP